MEVMSGLITKLLEITRPKSIVLILGSMRSGSTLLKSLLANAPDISYLPEVDFQKYSGLKALKLKLLAKEEILVLKKPAKYDAVKYPQVPRLISPKKIILIRDVGPTVNSLIRMNQAIDKNKFNQSPEELAINYWARTYLNLLDTFEIDNEETLLVKYEDLVSDPIGVTSSLFKFVGSEQMSGVDTYVPPESYKWGWGNDDGGEKIKTLAIQSDNEPLSHQDYYDHPEVKKLRELFNYG